MDTPQIIFGSMIFLKVVSYYIIQSLELEGASNRSDENIYIQSVFLNGKKHDYSYITHKQITNGGELKFIMGSKPNYGFGVNKKFRPKSIVY